VPLHSVQPRPELAQLYQRASKVERGRHHNQALCAVASHLTGRIWAVNRENRPHQLRDLDGQPITRDQARTIAAELVVDPDTLLATSSALSARSVGEARSWP
jgi:hypothetical protein